MTSTKPPVFQLEVIARHMGDDVASLSAEYQTIEDVGASMERVTEALRPCQDQCAKPTSDAMLKAIRYVVNNSDLGSDAPNGGLELRLYYDPDDEEYVASMRAGEFSGHSTAPTFELLLLSLPWVTEDTGAVLVGADGQLLCVGCEGTGVDDGDVCRDCNGRKTEWRDVNVVKDDPYP